MQTFASTAVASATVQGKQQQRLDLTSCSALRDSNDGQRPSSASTFSGEACDGSHATAPPLGRRQASKPQQRELLTESRDFAAYMQARRRSSSSVTVGAAVASEAQRISRPSSASSAGARWRATSQTVSLSQAVSSDSGAIPSDKVTADGAGRQSSKLLLHSRPLRPGSAGAVRKVSKEDLDATASSAARGGSKECHSSQGEAAHQPATPWLALQLQRQRESTARRSMCKARNAKLGICGQQVPARPVSSSRPRPGRPLMDFAGRGGRGRRCKDAAPLLQRSASSPALVLSTQPLDMGMCVPLGACGMGVPMGLVSIATEAWSRGVLSSTPAETFALTAQPEVMERR